MTAGLPSHMQADFSSKLYKWAPSGQRGLQPEPCRRPLAPGTWHQPEAPGRCAVCGAVPCSEPTVGRQTPLLPACPSRRLQPLADLVPGKRCPGEFLFCEDAMASRERASSVCRGSQGPRLATLGLLNWTSPSSLRSYPQPKETAVCELPAAKDTCSWPPPGRHLVALGSYSAHFRA